MPVLEVRGSGSGLQLRVVWLEGFNFRRLALRISVRGSCQTGSVGGPSLISDCSQNTPGAQSHDEVSLIEALHNILIQGIQDRNSGNYGLDPLNVSKP